MTTTTLLTVQSRLDGYHHRAAGGTDIAGTYSDPPHRWRWYVAHAVALWCAALKVAAGDAYEAARLPLSAVPGDWPAYPPDDRRRDA